MRSVRTILKLIVDRCLLPTPATILTCTTLKKHSVDRCLLPLPPHFTLSPRHARLNKVWSELEKIKGVIVEETEAASEFKATKKRYETAIDDPQGGKAVLLAVYRGKMSEVIYLRSEYRVLPPPPPLYFASCCSSSRSGRKYSLSGSPGCVRRVGSWDRL